MMNFSWRQAPGEPPRVVPPVSWWSGRSVRRCLWLFVLTESCWFLWVYRFKITTSWKTHSKCRKKITAKLVCIWWCLKKSCVGFRVMEERRLYISGSCTWNIWASEHPLERSPFDLSYLSSNMCIPNCLQKNPASIVKGFLLSGTRKLVWICLIPVESLPCKNVIKNGSTTRVRAQCFGWSWLGWIGGNPKWREGFGPVEM